MKHMNKKDVEKLRIEFYSEYRSMNSNKSSISEVKKHYYCGSVLLRLAKYCGVDPDLIYDLKKELDWDYEEIIGPEEERIKRVKEYLLNEKNKKDKRLS